MTRSRIKWTAALSLSVLVHAGAAALFMEPGEEVRIEGGQQAGVVVLGSAFEDMTSAGEPVETTDAIQPEAVPAEANAEPTQPAEAELVESVDRQVPLSAVATPEAEPVDSPVVVPDTAAAVDAEPSTATAVEAEPVEPVQADDAIAALAEVPLPTPRPAYTPPPPEKPEAAPAKPRRKQAKREATQAGSRGDDARDAKAGDADGGSSSTEGATRRSERRTASAAGNAAVSNYPGKIVSKLRRSLRYPSRAKRQTGEVHVRFVVSAKGAAGAVSVVRSSGSPILDQAALDTVRRAAPFPAIPSGAGRSSWTFTVPLAFTR